MSDNQSMPRVQTSGRITVTRRPLVDEGIYPCEIVSYEIFFMMGRHKLAVHGYLTGLGITLSLICNITLNEHKNIQYPGRRSKFGRLLGLLPLAEKTIDLNQLLGMKCMATVVTSTLDERRKLKPMRDHYSIIKDFYFDYSTDEEPVPF
jgi:hypothetical protein